MNKLSTSTVDIWVNLSRAHKSVLLGIEAALKKAKMPPLAWYDVLLELDRAGSKGLRAYLLKNKLLLPQHGLSRLLGRIEKAGYLEKFSCEEDGRGQVLVITKSGKIARKKIWAVYSVAMEEAIGKRFSQSDGEKLAELLSHLN